MEANGWLYACANLFHLYIGYEVEWAPRVGLDVMLQRIIPVPVENGNPGLRARS
jgi:hypothetical protein